MLQHQISAKIVKSKKNENSKDSVSSGKLLIILKLTVQNMNDWQNWNIFGLRRGRFPVSTRLRKARSNTVMKNTVRFQNKIIMGTTNVDYYW